MLRGTVNYVSVYDSKISNNYDSKFGNKVARFSRLNETFFCLFLK